MVWNEWQRKEQKNEANEREKTLKENAGAHTHTWRKNAKQKENEAAIFKMRRIKNDNNATIHIFVAMSMYVEQQHHTSTVSAHT